MPVRLSRVLSKASRLLELVVTLRGLCIFCGLELNAMVPGKKKLKKKEILITLHYEMKRE